MARDDFDDNQTDDNPYAAPESLSGERDGSETELAARSSRFVGALVDGIIMLALTLPIMFFTGYLDRVNPAQAQGQQPDMVETLGYQAVGMVIFLLVNGYLLATRGQSVGKLVVGTRIVDYQSGELVPLGKVFALRILPLQLVAVLPILGQLVPLIDALMVFSSERRCLHDLIAGTKVVTTRK